MNDKKAKRECQLCLQECDGPIEYGLSFGEMDAEECVDFDYKQVCSSCYGKIKVYALGMLFNDYSSRLKQVGSRFLANPMEG